MTRALEQLIHGNVCAALEFHRLIIPVTLLLLAESTFRAIALTLACRDRISPQWIKADIGAHAGLAMLVLLMFIVYS
jgi:hypothetical protein